MKKLFSILAVGLIAILSVTLVGCGNNEAKAKAVAEKIEKHEALNADDYDVMLDYIDAFANKALDYNQNLTKDFDMEKFTQALQKLNEEFPYVEQFAGATLMATDLTQAQQKRLEELVNNMSQSE